MKLSPIQYLKRELNFQISDWNQLTESDKNDLKRYAQDELEMRDDNMNWL